MSRKRKHLPEWFPFALGATAVVALFAGARSGWKLSGDQPKPSMPPLPPPPQGALRDWIGVNAPGA